MQAAQQISAPRARTTLRRSPIIERDAAQQFRDTPYAYLADDGLVSTRCRPRATSMWVAVDQDDQPFGFAIVHVLDESVHLHELDVHPRYARQGVGAS